MISIIICSRHPDIPDSLKNNIKDTIGDSILFEIICIDNSDNQHSIFSAYNEGVKKAKYDYLCFMHEDILFHSADWGKICIRYLNDDNGIGMLGVIGGHYLSKYSEGWWSSPFTSGQILQGQIVRGGGYTTRYICTQLKELGNNVVAIDGLWMFTRKSLFVETIQWDTDCFSGFHFYDLDICMQILRAGYKIKIADISIEHKSLGCFNKAFWDSYLIFHRKWNMFLPVSTSKITSKHISEYESKLVCQIYSYNTQIIDLQALLRKIGFYHMYRIYTTIRKFLNIGK